MTLDQVQTWEAKGAALSTQADGLPLIILQQHVLNTIQPLLFFCKEMDCCLCLPYERSHTENSCERNHGWGGPHKTGIFL